MLAKKLKKWYTKHKEYNMLANLLLRTEYSFMQSLCALKDVVKRSKELGYDSLAIVDFGNLHGGYKFYKECLKNDVKPIIGIEIELVKEDCKIPFQLYAMDNFGYQNLFKIASRYKIDRESIDINYIQKFGLGILGILSADSIIVQNQNSAYLKQLKETLSKFFIGITSNDLNNDYEKLHESLASLINSKEYAFDNLVKDELVEVE